MTRSPSAKRRSSRMCATDASSGAPTSARSDRLERWSASSLGVVAMWHMSRPAAVGWQLGDHERTIGPMTGQPLPSGTLTFLFTDIEGSTKLLNALGTDRFHEVLAVHAKALRGAFADGGTEIRTAGDSLFVVFHSAPKAVRASAAAQRAL